MEKIFGEFVTIGIGEMLLQIFIFCFIALRRGKVEAETCYYFGEIR